MNQNLGKRWRDLAFFFDGFDGLNTTLMLRNGIVKMRNLK